MTTGRTTFGPRPGTRDASGSGFAARCQIAFDAARVEWVLDQGRAARYTSRFHGTLAFLSTAAAGSASALDLAASGEFDLLILDIGLPGRDGISVLAALREGQHRIPDMRGG